MIDHVKRVEWAENRRVEGKHLETFYVIAEEQKLGHWHFFERESWEVRWFVISSTLQLRRRLRRELVERVRATRIGK